MDMQRLLRASVQFKASDLHVQAGSPPTVRVDGTMVAFNAPPVTAEEVRGLIAEVATEAHLEAPLPPLRDRGADVPADVEAVIRRCLAKRPLDRYPNAHAVAMALATCGCAGDWDAPRAEAWWRSRDAASSTTNQG